MDKDQQSSDTIDDYTFSFAAMDPGEQGNTSPYLFGASNSSSPRQEVSPAETLFLNGQLVPHTFPAHFTNSPRSNSDISRSVSWTTVSSKESITSSLRNSSTSSCSRSSSCNSSRNSRQNSSRRQGSGSEKANAVRKQVRFAPGVDAPTSQKLAPPSAITSFDVSGRGTGLQGAKKNGEEKKKQEAETRSWVGKTFFRPLVSACRVCRALEPGNQPVNPRVK